MSPVDGTTEVLSEELAPEDAAIGTPASTMVATIVDTTAAASARLATADVSISGLRLTCIDPLTLSPAGRTTGDELRRILRHFPITQRTDSLQQRVWIIMARPQRSSNGLWAPVLLSRARVRETVSQGAGDAASQIISVTSCRASD